MLLAEESVETIRIEDPCVFGAGRLQIRTSGYDLQDLSRGPAVSLGVVW